MIKKGSKIKSFKKVTSDFEKAFQQRKELNKLKNSIGRVKDRFGLLKINEFAGGDPEEVLDKISDSDQECIDRIQKNIKTEMEKIYPLESLKSNNRKNLKSVKRPTHSPYMVR